MINTVWPTTVWANNERLILQTYILIDLYHVKLYDMNNVPRHVRLRASEMLHP